MVASLLGAVLHKCIDKLEVTGKKSSVLHYVQFSDLGIIA